MSRMDDRIRELIEDRVNDLERLFLTSAPQGPTSEVDCCKDIVNRLKRLNDTINDIDSSVRDVKQRITYGDNYYFFPGEFNEPSDDAEDDEPLVTSDGTPLPDWLYSGIPPTLKDILDLLGQIVGGAIGIKSWPAFMKLIGRLLPFFFKYGGIVPLLNLVVGLWRGMGDRMDASQEKVRDWEILGRLKDLENKADENYKLLNEFATAGTPSQETSILLDRLQDILNNMLDYYNTIMQRFDDNEVQDTRRYTQLLELLQLIRSESISTDSNIECLAMWLKGNRSCEEFSTDVVSMLEAAAECCQYVRCHLDEYYHALDDKLDQLRGDITSGFEECHDTLNDLIQALTGPNNPIDRIDDGIERGNVVGTGSLVLNYANDLNIIKSRLAEIRRLL